LGLTSGGALYGWGQGFLDAKSKSNEPQLIPTPKKIAKINTGSKHAAVIDVDGLVYTWGYGGSWMNGGGQLGHNSTNSETQPR
jgi:alpha-tubulin suppressor-like RCC1 family protein